MLNIQGLRQFLELRLQPHMQLEEFLRLICSACNLNDDPEYAATALADVRDSQDHNNTIIHYLVLMGRVDLLRETLVRFPPKPSGIEAVETYALANLRNSDGQTPLHIAYQIGNREAAQVLERMGADREAKDRFGHAPWAYQAPDPVDRSPVRPSVTHAAMFARPAAVSQPSAQEEYYDEEQLMAQGVEIPNLFMCPISYEIMIDPVVATDGHTYERRAIQRWFEQQQEQGVQLTSPKTGQILDSARLIPNHAVRAQIRDLCGDPQPRAAGPAARA